MCTVIVILTKKTSSIARDSLPQQTLLHVPSQLFVGVMNLLPKSNLFSIPGPPIISLEGLRSRFQATFCDL